MRILLLGPLEVWVGQERVDLRRPRLGVLLAALAVDAGRPVPVDALVDRVWGHEPPDQARRTLHTYLTRLRRLAEQARDAGSGGTPARIVHRAGGYLLDLDPDRVDLHRFRGLVARAGGHATGTGTRRELLAHALGLWRGVPLAGLPGEWTERVRRSWQEQQVTAVLAWARAELDAGGAAAVLGPLGDLAAEHPLVEPIAAMRVRALAAAGRLADALACYGQMRARLAEELGADPGPDLRAAHQDALRGEPVRTPAPAGTGTGTGTGTGEPLPAGGPAGPVGLVGPVALPVPAGGFAPPGPAVDPARVVPSQLPADLRGFTGRDAELAELDALLPPGGGGGGSNGGGSPTAVVISAISGSAGVGKTALALHWAHRVCDRFPDGMLYVNLRGFHPAGEVMEPTVALRGFLLALGVSPGRIPSDLDARIALYRSLLAGRRMLVVLDNARDAEQARPLLPGASAGLVVVTSRDRLTSLVAADGALPLALDLLSTTDARELLAARLGAWRVEAEPVAVEEIVAACARLPLALGIAAARAQQSGFPLAALAAELSDVDGRLEALDGGDPVTRVRSVFSWSYTALSPAAARLFRLLGMHRGPDIGVAAVASLAGLPLVETRRLLAELARASLVTEHAPGRYSCHDLLGAYAADLASGTETADDRLAAVRRLLDHLVHSAHEAARLQYPSRDPVLLPLAEPAPGAVPERFDDEHAAVHWLATENQVLLVAAGLAADSGFADHAWQLAWAVDATLHRQGCWSEAVRCWQAALAATEGRDDPAPAAYAHRNIASAYTPLGRHGEAHAHLQQALDLFTRVGDQVGRARTHLALGIALDNQGQPERALGHGRQALALFRAAGHRRGQADALNGMGWEHTRLGDHERALGCCQQALAVYQEVGDRYGEAATWDSLGHAYHHLHRHAAAVECYQHAVALMRDLGDQVSRAGSLDGLGDTFAAAGDPAAANDSWREALALFVAIEHPGADTVRAKLANLPARTP